MDVVAEDVDNRVVVVSTPKREKHIKVFWPVYSNTGFWRIRYVDGTVIPELDGMFTSRSLAFKAIEEWEKTIRMTPKARYQDRPVAELKRKKRVGTSRSHD